MSNHSKPKEEKLIPAITIEIDIVSNESPEIDPADFENFYIKRLKENMEIINRIFAKFE